MMTSSTFSRVSVFLFVLLVSNCGGSGLDGKFVGQIGNKKEVQIEFLEGNDVKLSGYWTEPLLGEYERGSLKGKPVDTLVFFGPQDKNFKLRIAYETKKQELEVLAIHSRIIGPGARYVPTESESTFFPKNPILKKIKR